MKKKQLITSLAVTGVMMTSMVGNVFADSNTTDSTMSNIIPLENIISQKKDIDKTHFTNEPDYIPTSTPSTSTCVGYSAPMGCDDRFTVRVNVVNGAEFKAKDAPYEIKSEVKGNRINFTVTLKENQARLGNLEHSANQIDSRTKLDDETIEYKFHYSLLELGDRTININVYPKNSAPAVKI